MNPYRLGVVASTDTHNGTPGEVSEQAYPGHWGNNEDTPQARLGPNPVTPGGVLYSGGGLTAAWAEQNTRASLFEAFRRREVYGTSGPRITVRFFGGWDYPADLCQTAQSRRGRLSRRRTDGRRSARSTGRRRPVLRRIRPDG